MRMRVDIKGDKELLRALQRGDHVPDKLQNSVMKNGADMQKTAQDLAPVDTGFLKREIGLDVGAFEATVESKSEYAPYQEYGTRFQSGKPHIGPAFEKQKPLFEKSMDDIMREATGGGF